jgi:hypothetical protein
MATAPPDFSHTISTMEVHPRNHQAVAQEPELHVLATNRCASPAGCVGRDGVGGAERPGGGDAAN